jgi:hypothetical protein
VTVGPDVAAERRLSNLVSLGRRHWALLAVLGLAAAIRLAAALAYRPALMFPDSWAYLGAAYNGSPVGILPDKPSGYPLLLDLLALPGRSLAAITTTQHIAGLAIGVLTYVLLVRLGAARLVAAGASALVLLDSYLIALEQHVLAEAFFVLALTASALLITTTRRPLALGAAGLLLAGATLLRAAALFAVPVWLLYLAWVRPGWRAGAAAALGMVVPLLAYATLHDARTGTFGLTQFDGWYLYGRVAHLADCDRVEVPDRVRDLCPTPEQQRLAGADPNAFFLWDARSPARRRFGEPQTPEQKKLANDRLREFGTAVVRERPLDYLDGVARDYLRFFEPGAMSIISSYDDPITLPDESRPSGGGEVRRTYFPDYTGDVHPPAATLADYQRVVHTPRWLLAAFALAGLADLLLALLPSVRETLSHRREVFLLVGGGLAILLPAAMSHFEVRYLLPSVPLLAGGGVLALYDLAGLVRARRARASKTAEAQPGEAPAPSLAGSR